MRHNLMGDKASMEFTNNQDKINCPGLITTPLTTQQHKIFKVTKSNKQQGKKPKIKFSAEFCNFQQAFEVDRNEKIPAQVTKRETIKKLM